MNVEELNNALQEYYDSYDEIGVCVYAILKGNSNSSPLKLDIENEALVGIKKLFIQSLKDNISNKDELTLLNLSSADERVDAVYVYDLEIPAEFSSLETVVGQDDLPILNLKNDALLSIKALLIEIGNNKRQLILYKTMAPVNIFSRASFFLKKSANRLRKINDEFLRISVGFQMLRLNGTLLVLDLQSLERSFGFHDVIKREAISGMRAISDADILVNPDTLEELLDDIKYARKFTKIAKASPVLQGGISNQEIVRFCKTFPTLMGRIRFNEEKNKILLDTKVSKDLFIKLLMDDFLTSELTRFHYESVAKDSIGKR